MAKLASKDEFSVAKKEVKDFKQRFNKVFSLLQTNQNKDFVQRILDPDNSPSIVNADTGKASTHRMATAEADGIHYVYPTILRGKDGVLVQRNSAEAFQTAMEAGEVVGFKTAKEADWFERNWKVVWGHSPRRGK
jgi:hypothetical protein